MLTLAELRQCRLAAQMAVMWLESNRGTPERIEEMQALIGRIDEEIGDTADKTSFL